MKTLYLEKENKSKFLMRKYKIEGDNIKIYTDINKIKNINKIIKKLLKIGTTNVVLSEEINKNIELINALNSCNIRIFDGRWIEKYLVLEILEYIVNKKKAKKEETEIAIATNEVTDFSIEVIKKLARQYKRITVVTNHIEKLEKIEKEIYDKEGILIVVSNNHKKSFAKAPIILNLDFNYQLLNKYKINENAIIINIEGNMKILSKRFNGININDYEIEVKRIDEIWRENINKFEHKSLLEAQTYTKGNYENIHSQILKSKPVIKMLYGQNGKIERFS